jgi:hypothetical protein
MRVKSLVNRAKASLSTVNYQLSIKKAKASLSTVNCPLSIKKAKASLSIVNCQLSIILALSALMSCTQDAEMPALSVDQSSIEAAAVAGTYTLAVTADGEWTAAVSPAATWCTVSPASGSGNGTLTVAVAVNSTTAAKTATVTIAQSGTSQTVTVTARAADVFKDSRGNRVIVPGGALACATRVVSFTHGDPWTSDISHQNPDGILGIPDGDEPENGIGSICMGRLGVIVLGFDSYITDGEGLDIYVFEVGPDVEATKVEVSNDLKTWIHVGDAAGSLSGVDMRGKVPANGKYQYVRISDLRTFDHLSWPGADIDAVVALYPTEKLKNEGI